MFKLMLTPFLKEIVHDKFALFLQYLDPYMS